MSETGPVEHDVEIVVHRGLFAVGAKVAHDLETEIVFGAGDVGAEVSADEAVDGGHGVELQEGAAEVGVALLVSVARIRGGGGGVEIASAGWITGRTRTGVRQSLFHLPASPFSLSQPNPFLLQFPPLVIIIYVAKRACGRMMMDYGSKWRHTEVGAEEG